MCRGVEWPLKSNVIIWRNFQHKKNLVYYISSTILMIHNSLKSLRKQTVRARITGTQNIAKITKSMKMVSASKLRGDALRLKMADPFSVCRLVLKTTLYELFSNWLRPNWLFCFSTLGIRPEYHGASQRLGGPSHWRLSKEKLSHSNDHRQGSLRWC